MTNILLGTLGASWAVIPEAYALLAPDHLPLYRHHPDREDMERRRKQHGLAAPQEIWVCTSGGTRTGAECLRQWLHLLPNPPVLRLWEAENTIALTSRHECRHLRELIFRACLTASEQVGNGQLVLSLAGGRKTMSADLQAAGALFGCAALLHVIAREPLPEELRKGGPEFFATALPSGLSEAVLPLVVGSGRRSELLDVRLDHRGNVTTSRFPLPVPQNEESLIWPSPDEWLCDETVERENAGSRLLGNFLASLSQTEHHENWRGLYRLPPARIDELRKTPLDATHRDWLRALPKADLHRHVGGCLDLAAQIEVGHAVWADLSMTQRDAAQRRVAGLLKPGADWDWDWPERIREPKPLRSHAIAALLTQCDPQRLERELYGTTEPRVGLKYGRQGFAAYERPGELTGSAILAHPAAIEPYARMIVSQAVAEGLRYVELRGSPQKYGAGFLRDFFSALQQEAAKQPQGARPDFRFIVIADRKDRAGIGKVVLLAVRSKEDLNSFVVGLDLAGDEGTTRPEELAPEFLPAFRACLPITIHAGEGESAENIWQAAYQLHADRIGHGLSLSDNPQLAHRFRDRGICLELCPTSNREVIGYADPQIQASGAFPPYPLMALWRSGLPLTLCTDNPGISRTGLADEYLAAARMTPAGLTQWDALAMIKQGFAHAFLPADERERLMKTVDAAIYEQMVDRA
jgi:adenosine deaminase